MNVQFEEACDDVTGLAMQQVWLCNRSGYASTVALYSRMDCAKLKKIVMNDLNLCQCMHFFWDPKRGDTSLKL